MTLPVAGRTLRGKLEASSVLDQGDKSDLHPVQRADVDALMTTWCVHTTTAKLRHPSASPPSIRNPHSQLGLTLVLHPSLT